MSNTGIIKIVSQNGQGMESCNVNVRIVPELKNSTTSSVVRSMNSQNVLVYIKELQNSGYRNISDAEKGITQLSNKEAFYIIMRYTIGIVDIEIPTKSIVITTTRKDTVYSIALATLEPERFSQARMAT